MSLPQNPNRFAFRYVLNMYNVDCFEVDAGRSKINARDASLSLGTELVPNNFVTQLQKKQRVLSLDLRQYDMNGRLYKISTFKDVVVATHEADGSSRNLVFSFSKREEK